jgi:ELWxxDGT repeat protein
MGITGWGYSDVNVLGEALSLGTHDGVYGVELWRTDGTAEGTTLVRDVRPGAKASESFIRAVVGDALYLVSEGKRVEWTRSWMGKNVRLDRPFGRSRSAQRPQNGP